MDTFFIVVYPNGDQSRLSVAEISYECEYEMSDYDLASREKFDDETAAEEYARTLAKRYKLKLKGVHNILD